jgi:hypothetical protein
MNREKLLYFDNTIGKPVFDINRRNVIKIRVFGNIGCTSSTHNSTYSMRRNSSERVGYPIVTIIIDEIGEPFRWGIIVLT